MIGVQVGADLTHHADFDHLFRRWLSGDETLGGATDELQTFLAGRDGEPIRPAPAWSDDAWRTAWLTDLLADQPTDADRDACRDAVARLTRGEAEVVITGQQPGFLGGPLYTWYKIATTVVLAELRTAAGTPTVPVFWSAGDDDDLREALLPVVWDPARELLLRHDDAGRPRQTDRMVGLLDAAEVGRGEAAWLAAQAHRHALAHDLAALWRDGVANHLDWGRLHRRALLRVFQGRGLLVVHGNDPAMHAAAAPFYDDLWVRRDAAREAARRGGASLETAGHARALGEPSIQRFLHHGRDGRRHPLPADYAGELPPAAELRPGVMARSPVQDWLFRPAGVVVGPGEVAYLKQLVPLYHTFGLERASLLPRLFAQLGPEGHGEFRAWALDLADREDAAEPGDDGREEARRVAEAAQRELRDHLRRETGADQARLDQLTRQVLDRWARYLEGVVGREQQRRREQPAGEQAPWLRPDGRRQERSLAAVGASVLWGDDFVGALAHAGRRHLDAGLAGDWREYLLTVPDPGGDVGS